MSIEDQREVKDAWEVFSKQICDFNDFGKETRYFNKEIDGISVPFFVNEFWTSKQRAAHSLHEVSYRACFKPQLPRFFVERLTNEGATVYDPFMGRGTTLLESAFLGRKAIGNDINPVSKMLCEPRFKPPKLERVEERLREIQWDAFVLLDTSVRSDLAAFYHEETLDKLIALRSHILSKQANGSLDTVDKWIRMVATNRLTGHSAGFFSVYSLPPNQAVLPERQRLINAKRQQKPEPKDVVAIILKKSKSLLSDLTQQEIDCMAQYGHEIGIAEADVTDYLEDESVDLVVTSPPFLDVVDYRTDNWLRCWFNGVDSNALPISQLRKPEQWIQKMTQVMIELRRVLKPTGWIAFEVGEVNGGKTLLEDLVIQAAIAANVKVHGVVINDQQFTKTANCWGVGNQNKGTNTNRIVMLTR